MLSNQIVEEIKKKSNSKFSEFFKDKSFDLAIELKTDNSPVTKLDEYVSEMIAEVLHRNFPKISIICEENKNRNLAFPCFVVDPIDGTRELIKGIGECALSIAYLNSERIDDPLNSGWIYNPFTQFELKSWEALPLGSVGELHWGLISRSEFKRHSSELKNKPLHVIPMGSIAYKLALVARRIGHFTFTKRPKSLWDIAAGTVILAKQGVWCFCSGKKLEKFEKLEFAPPMLWCCDRDRSFICETFQI